MKSHAKWLQRLLESLHQLVGGPKNVQGRTPAMRQEVWRKAAIKSTVNFIRRVEENWHFYSSGNGRADDRSKPLSQTIQAPVPSHRQSFASNKVVLIARSHNQCGIPTGLRLYLYMARDIVEVSDGWESRWAVYNYAQCQHQQFMTYAQGF